MPDGSLLFDILNGRRAEEWTAQRLAPLLELAGEHGLIALVHDALQKNGAEIPDEWNEIAAELALNSSVHIKAAADLSAAFEAAKVDAGFAKGLALALTVYEKPAWRPFVDIDV